ncbi:U32 family peptidase [Clostridium aestuarii]|uniref:U32 family peptidase n=1 Tax=Clostridium aestuarii TaxID=338193 RepID=A0ABT4D0H4_9CLOT|nr:U32 family peptidase [Clostridium aestuarii]MCY6483548.1 U32 family peptidase [Clostridium aestuarii]
MKKIELLAPAGSMESLYAAVQNGADAIYVGGTKFSARAYASNFDEENMIEAVEYCHLYDVKIYVTANILIKENEISEAMDYIKFLYEIGVDALIIQDTGLAELIKRNFPDFEIHASTQMTVHNPEGALLLKKLGFSRIVLSRELSLNEIEYISKNLGVETEIFTHGALCISYSGQCLMSSLIGGRSGNRGKCAQPCRLPYTLINRDIMKEKKGYILSPKDICTLENIKEIIESGTSSLKIEGRMKRPEYVAGVVSAYRKAIDEFYGSKQLKSSMKNFNVNKEKKKLLQLFNREGFSSAYLFGNIGKNMMAYNFPKNTGVKIGEVNKDLALKLEENLSVKDGIRFGNDGFVVSKIIKDCENVDEAYVGDEVKLKPTKYKIGDILYKTSDIKLLENLSKTYSNIYERKNGLNLIVKFNVGEPLTLRTYYKDKDFEVIGEVVQKALKKPLDKEKIIKNLNKTGDTAFQFINIDFESFEEGFLPVSLVNSMRRKLLQKIVEYIINKDKRSMQKGLNLNLSSKKEKRDKIDNPLVIVTTKDQLKAVQEYQIENIAVELFMKECDIDITEVRCKNLYIKTASIIKNEFESVCNIIEENLSHIKGIVTCNLGIIKRFKEKTKIIGDYKLNIFNSYSLEFYKDMVDTASISLELNKKEISNLMRKAVIPCLLIVYGKTELMISEHCPIGSMFGNKTNNNICSRECENGNYVLKDRIGEEFPLKMDKYCRSHIYNSSAINLIPNFEEIKKLNIDFLRLDFTDENYEDTLKIMNAFKEKKYEGDFTKYTRGHFKRGVE